MFPLNHVKKKRIFPGQAMSTDLPEAGATLRSRLHLVDLAGSERLRLGDGFLG